MIRLSARLEVVAACVSPVDTVADIGTDHAYLAVRLIEAHRAQRVIASDINQGPVDNALETVLRHGMTDRIQVICAPGLEGLTVPVDTIVIAGMGGMLITQILEEGRMVAMDARRLVLQPMTAGDVLRRYLLERGWTLVSERIAVEGEKFYEIIMAEPGTAALWERSIDYEISPVLIQNSDEHVLAFIQRKIRITREILHQIETKGQYGSEESRAWQERLVQLLEVEAQCVSILRTS